MKQLKFNALIFVAFLLVSGMLATPALSNDPVPAPAADSTPAQFTAYYFHTNMRCTSCKRIEQWSHEAIAGRFARQLSAGTLQWKVVNVETPENEHFVKDFNLYTKSLVIVENAGGTVTRWENLDKVWHFLQDEQLFSEYVAGQVSAFMEKK